MGWCDFFLTNHVVIVYAHRIFFSLLLSWTALFYMPICWVCAVFLHDSIHLNASAQWFLFCRQIVTFVNWLCNESHCLIAGKSVLREYFNNSRWKKQRPLTASTIMKSIAFSTLVSIQFFRKTNFIHIWNLWTCLSVRLCSVSFYYFRISGSQQTAEQL